MAPYIESEEAETWLSGHVVFILEWTAASDDQRAAALEEASDHIDDLSLKGYRYSDSQAREFPRIPDKVIQVTPYDSEIDFQGGGIDYSEVPQAILDACCLEALEILKQGNSVRRENQEQGVQAQKISDSSETYVEGAGLQTLWSLRARKKLAYWIAGAVEGV
jgi:hypothetical protein